MHWLLRLWPLFAAMLVAAGLQGKLLHHQYRRRWLSASNGDEHFMRLALRHAQFAFREKEVPVGAVVVDGEGRVVAAGRNGVEQQKDATAHAEISVLRKAAKLIGNWRLQDCTLYTTLEPCAMCFSAAQGFRVKRVVYGAKDLRLGALGSWINLSDTAHPFHNIEVTSGVLEEESGTLLKRFFQLRRREKSSSKVGKEEEEEEET
jgi:tRNA(adenine34) deaminase